MIGWPSSWAAPASRLLVSARCIFKPDRISEEDGYFGHISVWRCKNVFSLLVESENEFPCSKFWRFVNGEDILRLRKVYTHHTSQPRSWQWQTRQTTSNWVVSSNNCTPITSLPPLIPPLLLLVLSCISRMLRHHSSQPIALQAHLLPLTR